MEQINISSVYTYITNKKSKEIFMKEINLITNEKDYEKLLSDYSDKVIGYGYKTTIKITKINEKKLWGKVIATDKPEWENLVYYSDDICMLRSEISEEVNVDDCVCSG